MISLIVGAGAGNMSLIRWFLGAMCRKSRGHCFVEFTVTWGLIFELEMAVVCHKLRKLNKLLLLDWGQPKYWTLKMFFKPLVINFLIINYLIRKYVDATKLRCLPLDHVLIVSSRRWLRYGEEIFFLKSYAFPKYIILTHVDAFWKHFVGEDHISSSPSKL